MDIMLICSFRIMFACLCGAVIGFERTTRLKDAGIRTHCIIAIASALLMELSKYGFNDLIGEGGFLYGTDGVDSARIAAQVVAGIGFLGAGVIFRDGDTLKGLSTAAGVLATAGIGMAIGGGLWQLGIVATAMVVGIQVIFHKFSVGFDSYSENEITVIFGEDKKIVDYIDGLTKKGDVKIKTISIVRKGARIEKTYHIIYKYKTNVNEIMENLAAFEMVESISLK